MARLAIALTALISVLPIAAAASCATASEFTDGDAGPGGGDGSCTLLTRYADSDGDGFGNLSDPVSTCDANLPGTSDNSTDCDDTRNQVFPDATELCDTFDNDCNGTPDDGHCAIGCADGEREGFTDLLTAADIAGCAGAFRLPGVLTPLSRRCQLAGDDSTNADGLGCGSLDLCADGWHVCSTSAEVTASTTTGGCTGATKAGDPQLFFVTSQSGAGETQCGSGANDLFGCGNIGAAPGGSCAPLNRFSNDLCVDLGAPWTCGADGNNEASNVTKPASERGGVLCCRDAS